MNRSRHLALPLCVAALLLLNACGEKENQVTSKNELVTFLDSLEERYESACVRMGLSNWNSYAKEGVYDLDSAKGEFRKIFTDTTTRRTIDEWRKRSNSLADKLLARRLELWHRCFIGGAIYADSEIAVLENSLQQRITDFKFTLGNKRLTRAEIINGLREEKRQAQRHALWSATSQCSVVASSDLIRLIKLRNKKAAEFGFPNYYSLAFHLQAIDEGWLLATLKSLEEQTRKPFQEFVTASAKKLRLKELGPWDFDYALRETANLPDRDFPSDSVFDIIHRFEKGIGFGVDSLPIQEVVKDIPYNGLSLAIKIPSDSRFLLNPTKGKGFYGVAFHEYGHSLKAVHTNVDYPILKGYEWIPGAQCAAYEEGVADMHAEFTDDSLWLTTFTKARQPLIEKYVTGRSLPALYRLRRLLKDFFIEYELYRDPDQDPAALERRMFKKYLLVDIDESEPGQFAASIWYTAYPCYYQNYIVSAMIANQLQEALTSKFGDRKISDPKVARWMISRLYESGETAEWNERIRTATGKSLEPGAYLRKLGIEQDQLITSNENR